MLNYKFDFIHLNEDKKIERCFLTEFLVHYQHIGIIDTESRSETYDDNTTKFVSK
jgi:hypothetical protein